MKKTVFLLASLFVMMLATQRVNAEDPSADVTATIVQAISIDKITDLKFGKIVASSTAGKVQIQTNGSRTIASGDVVLFNEGSDHQAASFKVSGTPNKTYSLDFPSSIYLTGPAGSDPMTVEEFVHSASGTLSTSGEETFNVGATLNVGASQAPGQYTGTFTVIAAYN
jgi:spore coat protein U-like protein